MSYPTFERYPDFTPTFTPAEMFKEGVFGGAYFRKIYSSITEENYRKRHKLYKCLKGVDKNLLVQHEFDYSLNKLGVKAGSSLEEWESKGWITYHDPYGWVEWYCRFYDRETLDEKPELSDEDKQEDERQVGRWHKYCGPKSGRWRTRIANLIEKAGGWEFREETSKVIRQGLLQWAYEMSEEDYEAKINK